MITIQSNKITGLNTQSLIPLNLYKDISYIQDFDFTSGVLGYSNQVFKLKATGNSNAIENLINFSGKPIEKFVFCNDYHPHPYAFSEQTYSLTLYKDGTIFGKGQEIDGRQRIDTVTDGNFLTGVKDISAGTYFAVATYNSGSYSGLITGWGEQWSFLFGNEANTFWRSGITGVDKVYAGHNSVLAILNNGRITGWMAMVDEGAGAMEYGKDDRIFNSVMYGDYDYHMPNITGAVKIVSTKTEAQSNFMGDPGGDYAIAIYNSGSYIGLITGWGDFDFQRPPVFLTGVVDAAVTYNFNTFVVLNNGTITGWGPNPQTFLNSSFQNLNINLKSGIRDIKAYTRYSGLTYGYYVSPSTIRSATKINQVFLTYNSSQDLSQYVCGFPGEIEESGNFNFYLKGQEGVDVDFNTKHKVIIYQSGANYSGYLPIYETKFNNYNTNSISNFNLQLDSGSYKTKITSIYQENKQYNLGCANGIEVLNLIDISRSNQSGLEIFKTSARLVLEDFIVESGKNKVSNVYFYDDPYKITGFNFTNSTGVLFNSVINTAAKNKIKEGTSILEAMNYINRVSWTNSTNTIKIVNIITNNIPYIIANRSNKDIRAIYSPPFEIKYRQLENAIATNTSDKYLNIIYFDKKLNLDLDEKNSDFDENQIKLFYKNLVFKLGGSFGYNTIYPMTKSINDARFYQKQRSNC